MTLKGGTSQACAACKYQRRRCTQTCLLAPFFPPDQPEIFQHAHKLFGVSNILKILKKLPSEQHALTMKSIIYQANERRRDPVHGCLGIICQLRYQIWSCEQELFAVLNRLQMCRQQQQMGSSMAPQDHNHNQHDNQSQLELGMAPPTTINEDVMFQFPCNINNSYHMNNNISSSSLARHPLVGDIQQEVVQEYDEMPFFDTTMDDRQSYLDTKEPYGQSSSDNSVRKDMTHSIDCLTNKDLKSAAACLSLTRS
ncbi:LOB domain-containing protein 27 [Humulus lupulus]|uniref:LOB domain-containing protein 27 n=1 Tax=Humulus lupulus TaxID=3486 RepID=UPI002B4113BF|nr:LOB domain-containing protein 27 [Humulus lupulus]